MRVHEFRELGEDLHDLVRTLSAGSHHDDVSVTLLCDGVLEHGLSASERTRDEARTSLCDRVEGVNDADTCFHDSVRSRFFLVAFDCHFHRPFLSHGDFHILAFGIGQHCDDLVNIVFALFND